MILLLLCKMMILTAFRRYLTSLDRETKAFKSLIEEKARMTVPVKTTVSERFFVFLFLLPALEEHCCKRLFSSFHITLEDQGKQAPYVSLPHSRRPR